MRGREAARAAGRRAQDALTAAGSARAELATERAERKRETDALRAEIGRLKADHIAEASRLATEEVNRRLAELEAERKAKGLSDDIAHNLLTLKDKFVYNACRYISMTTGEPPLNALSMVMTWMTDEDFYGFSRPDFIVKLGLPSTGWVAWFVNTHKHDLRRIARARIRNGDAAAVSLEHVLEKGHPRIHPRFNPRWYPPIEYRGGIELVDDTA